MAWIEISKSNLFHNLDYFSSLVGGKEKLSIGLKDNAYGHGIEKIARLCVDYGITNVFVKNDFEALLIESFGFESIIIMHGTGEVKYIGNKNVAVVSIEQLQKIENGSNIELKIDTGMHRNGILPNELDEAVLLIKNKSLNLIGVFTHLLSADENNERITAQENCFQYSVKKITESIKSKFKVHCANTCGSHRVDVNKYDLFRIGLGIYGYIEIESFQKKLKPIMSLIASRISTRTISANETIGYGGSGFVNLFDEFTVSCYDIGYGDGFFRLNENKTYILDDGRSILGRVSMDSLSLEGSDESVTLFNNVYRLAKVHNTITYEILTALNPTLKRVVVE